MGSLYKILSWCFIMALAGAVQAQVPPEMKGKPEPKAFLQKGEAPPKGSAHGSSPLLTYQGGGVLLTSKTYSIFWGSKWNDANFAGDKIMGIDRFFDGFGGSSYSMTAKEYYDTAGYISANSSYAGHLIDSSTPPAKAPQVSTLVAEVCKLTANAPDSSGVYFIYTSSAAGQVNYCAWHSWGTCSNGAKVQVAYMPNLDGIAGCDPGDSSSGNSKGLAAIANVTAHELLESITDPRGTGWYDNSGQEDGDKCAWSFPAANNGLSTFVNGSVFKLQMEWSNAAYTAGSGQANLSGQKGCIY